MDQPFVLTPEILTSLSAVVLSLAFSYIPGLNTAFARLKPETKRLIMAGLLLVVAGVIFALGCTKIITTGMTCDQNGVVKLVWMYILAIIANQSVYQITPVPTTVRKAALAHAEKVSDT